MKTKIMTWNNEKRTCIQQVCQLCKKRFWVPENRRAKYCSRDCSDKSKNTQIICKCTRCGNRFYRRLSKLKNSKSGLYFCSKHCKDMAQTIEGGIKAIQPSHYGNGKASYRDKAFRHHRAICCVCGWMKDIRILQVHHKDHDRTNNHINNLAIVCPNCHMMETLGYIEIK